MDPIAPTRDREERQPASGLEQARLSPGRWTVGGWAVDRCEPGGGPALFAATLRGCREQIAARAALEDPRAACGRQPDGDRDPGGEGPDGPRG